MKSEGAKHLLCRAFAPSRLAGSYAVFAALWLAVGLGHAEDWHRLGNYRWDARLAVVLENPADEALDHVPVSIPLKDLSQKLATVAPGHIGVVDPNAMGRRAGDGRELMTLKGHSGRVISVAFSPDGRQIASGAEDGTILIFPAADWK
jgi:WD40 repeat protein